MNISLHLLKKIASVSRYLLLCICNMVTSHTHTYSLKINKKYGHESHTYIFTEKKKKYGHESQAYIFTGKKNGHNTKIFTEN